MIMSISFENNTFIFYCDVGFAIRITSFTAPPSFGIYALPNDFIIIGVPILILNQDTSSRSVRCLICHRDWRIKKKSWTSYRRVEIDQILSNKIIHAKDIYNHCRSHRRHLIDINDPDALLLNKLHRI